MGKRESTRKERDHIITLEYFGSRVREKIYKPTRAQREDPEYWHTVIQEGLDSGMLKSAFYGHLDEE